MKGVIKDFWEDTEYHTKMSKVVTLNLLKVNREKQRSASSIAGLEQVRTKKGIFNPDIKSFIKQRGKEWALNNPDLTFKRSHESHRNRVKEDYLRMAHTKAKWLPLSPDGVLYGSVAEAAYLLNIPKHNIDNWSRRNQHGWTRILNTDKA